MLPLDPTQEAGGRGGWGGLGRIEETSHSPWIAIAVFYNTEVREDTMQEGKKGQLHQSRGEQIIMGGG